MKLKLIIFTVFLFIFPTFGNGKVVEIKNLKIKNQCLNTTEKIAFNAYFEIDYTQPKNLKRKEIYQFICEKKSRKCGGWSLDLSKNEINIMSTNTPAGATLAVSKGSVFIIEWGTFRTFTVDTSKNSIEYRESGKSFLKGENTEGFAKAYCDPH